MRLSKVTSLPGKELWKNKTKRRIQKSSAQCLPCPAVAGLVLSVVLSLDISLVLGGP